MTPIKAIILFGNMVLVEDWAGGIELKATSPSDSDAEWLANSLAAFHKVPLSTSSSSTMPVTLSCR